MKISDLKDYKVLGNVSSIPPVQEPKSIGHKVSDVATSISDFFGAKGLTDLAGSQIAKFSLAAKGNMDAANRVTQPSLKEVIGSTIQTGANFLPGVGIGAGLAKKVAIGAGTGYAFDVGSKLQQDKTISESVTPGIGTAVGAGLPLVGAALQPVKAILGRLFKGLGSGLSGVSTNSIDEIVTNPQKAQQVSQQIAKSGNDKVLEQNARQIIDGVSKVRQEARTAFGEGLSQLKKEDIDPKLFRKSVGTFLDKMGVSLNQKTNTRFLDNVEFNDPKNLQKASNLIDKISKTELDGLSVRNLLDTIEKTKFRTAVDNEHLAFNAFVKDLGTSVKEAVTGSTDKLGKINSAFSQDMQLVEAVEDIFGKVDFKNLPEVVKASKKLETLFAQKGLAPSVIDTFLKRIGTSPADFRTSEAVRQISGKVSGSNTKGLSVGELVQSVTSAVITPNAIKNISIATGLAKESFVPFLQKLKPATRNIVIQALLQGNQGDSQ